jgi:hypothetical protein
VAMAASVSLQEDQAKQKQRIDASKLYFDVPSDEKVSCTLICVFRHPFWIVLVDCQWPGFSAP